MFCKAKPPNQLLDHDFSACSAVFMKRNGPLDVGLDSPASLGFGDPTLHIAIHTVADEGASHSQPAQSLCTCGTVWRPWQFWVLIILKLIIVLAIKNLKIHKLFFFSQLSVLWGTLACRKQSPRIAGRYMLWVCGRQCLLAAANPSQGWLATLWWERGWLEVV